MDSEKNTMLDSELLEKLKLEQFFAMPGLEFMTL